jgi:hypothetical protein
MQQQLIDNFLRQPHTRLLVPGQDQRQPVPANGRPFDAGANGIYYFSWVGQALRQ